MEWRWIVRWGTTERVALMGFWRNRRSHWPPESNVCAAHRSEWVQFVSTVCDCELATAGTVTRFASSQDVSENSYRVWVWCWGRFEIFKQIATIFFSSKKYYCVGMCCDLLPSKHMNKPLASVTAWKLQVWLSQKGKIILVVCLAYLLCRLFGTV
jgi:hypothetical protein